MEGQTRLLVVDKETDEELRRRQLTCTEEMAQRGLPPAHDPWEPKPGWTRAGSLGSKDGQKVWQDSAHRDHLGFSRNHLGLSVAVSVSRSLQKALSQPLLPLRALLCPW